MSETEVITVRYWASARSAAGLDSETIDPADLRGDGPTTLAAVRRELDRRHPDGRLTRVLDVCSVLLGSRPVATEDPADVVVPPGSTLEFLPPFAGG